MPNDASADERKEQAALRAAKLRDRLDACLRDGRPYRSLAVRLLALYWSCAPAKVRSLINRKLLDAVDLGFGKRRLRITPAAILECERRLAVKKHTTRRKRRDDIDPQIAHLLEAS